VYNQTGIFSVDILLYKMLDFVVAQAGYILQDLSVNKIDRAKTVTANRSVIVYIT
jgi:hypothetical protein